MATPADLAEAATRNRGSHAGPPQGSLAARPTRSQPFSPRGPPGPSLAAMPTLCGALHSLGVFWLTNTIDRIVKEPQATLLRRPTAAGSRRTADHQVARPPPTRSPPRQRPVQAASGNPPGLAAISEIFNVQELLYQRPSFRSNPWFDFRRPVVGFVDGRGPGPIMVEVFGWCRVLWGREGGLRPPEFPSGGMSGPRAVVGTMQADF